MTHVIHVPGAEVLTPQEEKQLFQQDVKLGLEHHQKRIFSKYFYDAAGSDIFNQITRHPDYYLTRCELEILETHKEYIASLMEGDAFNLVELGPGEGLKTNILLKQLLSRDLRFRYIPIDISPTYLDVLAKQCKQQLPNVTLNPIHADYLKGLEWLKLHSERRNFILFLGSSIGNFDADQTTHFLQQLQSALRPGDYVLIGFDLRKDTDILLRAYDDRDGITAEFNLNLLRRINRELGGHFQLEHFRHFATYNVYLGTMESYLISLKPQMVNIDELNQSFWFNEVEPIHLEYSFKYLLPQIEEMATAAGFHVVRHLLDSKRYFVDSIWQVPT